VRAVDLLAAIALFAGLGFAAFDDMITVTIGASHGNEYHGSSPYQGGPQHGIVPGESTDLKHYPNLYNERPAWLDNVHRALDTAVAEAYGWHPDMPDDEMLTKLLALNLERGKEHPRQ
jgi:hypothetical protein